MWGAINQHAYFRTTFDVDLLIQERDVEPALEFFHGHGYETLHRTQNFVRLRFAADPGAALPIDLMLADTPTFAKIRQQSRRAELGDGLILPIPSALHLIAMKLHALRSPARAESGVDLLDVKHLIKSAQIDISGKEFTEIRSVMQPRAPEQRLNKNSAVEHDLDGTGFLALPEFDSLPAAAGLSNTDAFRLSLRHALTLWPRLCSEQAGSAHEVGDAERFSLA